MRWSRNSVPRAPEIALILTLAAMPAAGDVAYVTCQNGDAMSVFDLDTGEELHRIAVPGKPAGVAVSARSGVWTVSPDSKVVRRYSPAGEVQAEVVLDGGPIGIALDEARGRVFVSDWYDARIWVLDAVTLAVVDHLPTGAAPAGLALSGDGAYLAVAEKDADRVSIFDAGTLAPVHVVTVGTRPFGLRFAPDGRLFVGNVGSNDLSVIDPATGGILATVPVGERPYGVAFAAGKAFVTNQYANSVSVVSLDGLAALGTVEVGEYPEGIDHTSDGRIAVANWFDNTLTLIDAETLEVVGTLDTADGPRAFGRFIAEGDK